MMIKRNVYKMQYYKYSQDTLSCPPHTDKVVASSVEDAIEIIKVVCKEKEWKDFKIYGIEATGDYVWVRES